MFDCALIDMAKLDLDEGNMTCVWEVVDYRFENIFVEFQIGILYLCEREIERIYNRS